MIVGIYALFIIVIIRFIRGLVVKILGMKIIGGSGIEGIGLFGFRFRVLIAAVDCSLSIFITVFIGFQF